MPSTDVHAHTNNYLDKPNHMLEYNIGLNNNFCLEDVQERVNFTIHCNSVQNFVPHSVEWTYDHGIVLDLNQHESNNIIQFENGRYSLAFGPASLLDIISALNVSDESTSLVVSCQLLNDFGEDAASIQISKCGRCIIMYKLKHTMGLLKIKTVVFPFLC